jgi:hypothetical protein
VNHRHFPAPLWLGSIDPPFDLSKRKFPLGKDRSRQGADRHDREGGRSTRMSDPGVRTSEARRIEEITPSPTPSPSLSTVRASSTDLALLARLRVHDPSTRVQDWRDRSPTRRFVFGWIETKGLLAWTLVDGSCTRSYRPCAHRAPTSPFSPDSACTTHPQGSKPAGLSFLSTQKQIDASGIYLGLDPCGWVVHAESGEKGEVGARCAHGR